MTHPAAKLEDEEQGSMQAYFMALADFLQQQMLGKESFHCWFAAEATDFVRFNHSVIRQPGHVRQFSLELTLVEAGRHTGGSLSLAGDLASDQAPIADLLAQLRAILPDLPVDPHFVAPDAVHSSQHRQNAAMPASEAIVDQVLAAAKGVDLVGILAVGPIYRGFANAAGQRNWHETASFNLDWSLYQSRDEQSRDKAVKTSYAGFVWDDALFAEKIAVAKAQLAMLERPPITVPPGAYRAYLTPTALGELVGMFNWSGFSEKALRIKQSALRQMRDEGVRLHPMLSMSENTQAGLACAFQAQGFIKPPQVVLIEQGRLVASMISPRTAMEYGLESNGADGGDAVSSLDVAAGSLAMQDALAELGTGIYVSNLWYLNYSDRANCRVTGMTRFATFWVENGEIVAPLNVMRFDDTLFRLLGENLLALTRERELLIDNGSYGGRGTESTRVPGALVSAMRFVL